MSLCVLFLFPPGYTEGKGTPDSSMARQGTEFSSIRIHYAKGMPICRRQQWLSSISFLHLPEVGVRSWVSLVMLEHDTAGGVDQGGWAWGNKNALFLWHYLGRESKR